MVSLTGVPVGVKDLYEVEGMPLSAGSDLPAEQLAAIVGGEVSALTRTSHSEAQC